MLSVDFNSGMLPFAQHDIVCEFVNSTLLILTRAKDEVFCFSPRDTGITS